MPVDSNIIDGILSVPISSLLTWIVVVGVVVSAISAVAIKLYKVFKGAYESKVERDKIDILVQNHEKKLNEIYERLSDIQKTLEKQDKVDFKRLRHEIVEAAEKALEKGCITFARSKSLEEMYEEYVNDYKGNGYVTNLIKKVRQLEVVGKIED